MRFKSESLIKEYEQMPETLKEVSETFEILSKLFGIDPMVTRIKEKIEGSSGVHEAGRAIDFRCAFNGVDIYNEKQRQAISLFLDAKFPRKDKKPIIIWHSFKGGPMHAHVQIPVDWV